MGGMGNAMSAEWLFLDSGELQVTTNGNAHRQRQHRRQEPDDPAAVLPLGLG